MFLKSFDEAAGPPGGLEKRLGFQRWMIVQQVKNQLVGELERGVVLLVT